jgi:hypothetical protein
MALAQHKGSIRLPSHIIQMVVDTASLTRMMTSLNVAT